MERHHLVRHQNLLLLLLLEQCLIIDHSSIKPFVYLCSSPLSPVQTDAKLLANNSQHCWKLHVASVWTPCYMLLDVVAQSLKPVKLFSQQLPTFLLFCDRRSVAQRCWIRLHSSSNIVGAAHAHYVWFTKTYWLYPSHDAVQVPILFPDVLTLNNIDRNQRSAERP